jgi:hypothetical protein
MAIEQLGVLPPVLQPEEGVSFWQPRPTNGYVTVKTSPSYGGPSAITMGIQVIPPRCFVQEHSHDRQVEIPNVCADLPACPSSRELGASRRNPP